MILLNSTAYEPILYVPACPSKPRSHEARAGYPGISPVGRRRPVGRPLATGTAGGDDLSGEIGVVVEASLGEPGTGLVGELVTL